MNINKLTKLVFASGLVAVLTAFSTANANTMTIDYYTIAETDRDANHLTGGTFNNEVKNNLGIDGLPVLNTTAFGCLSNCFSATGAPKDVLANGEITYWSPTLNNGGTAGVSDVSHTSTATVTLPFNVSSNFFPPNGTGPNDSNGFQAATLTSTLTNLVAETISFSIGADDMAFAYLDGNIVCDLGGVHPSTAGTCTTTTINPGTHSLKVFFVDINNVQSGLNFNVTTQNVETASVSVPEPSLLTLLALGLTGLGMVRRKQTYRL